MAGGENNHYVIYSMRDFRVHDVCCVSESSIGGLKREYAPKVGPLGHRIIGESDYHGMKDETRGSKVKLDFTDRLREEHKQRMSAEAMEFLG